MRNLITVKLKEEREFSLLGMDTTTIPAGALGVVIDASARITKDKELSCVYTVYWLVEDHASECSGEMLEVVSFPHRDSDVEAITQRIAELAQVLVRVRSLDNFPDFIAVPNAEEFIKDLARFDEILGGSSKAGKVGDA